MRRIAVFWIVIAVLTSAAVALAGDGVRIPSSSDVRSLERTARRPLVPSFASGAGGSAAALVGGVRAVCGPGAIADPAGVSGAFAGLVGQATDVLVSAVLEGTAGRPVAKTRSAGAGSTVFAGSIQGSGSGEKRHASSTEVTMRTPLAGCRTLELQPGR
jgi:hypothetical protein